MSRWDEVLRQRSFVCTLPGAELERFPYLSGYGLALRVIRLTALDPIDLKDQLAVRGGARADLFALTRRCDRWQRAFAHRMGLENSDVPLFWTEQSWSPLQLHGAFEAASSHRVRHCPVCARFGYHTMAFQLPSITECPWHGDRLQDRCPECATPSAGTFGPGGALGACVCGHDRFDVDCAATRMWEFPTHAAASWLAAYLAWAESERPSRHLVVRAGAASQEWEPAFAALAAAPDGLFKPNRSPTVEVRSYPGTALSAVPEGHFWGWSQLSDDRRPLTLLALPASVKSTLESATERAIAALPQKAATPAVLVRTRGFERGETLARNVANRSDCFIAPFGERDSGATWLDVSAVDPCSLAVCERLVQIAAEAFGGLGVTTDRSWQAARSEALDRVCGGNALDEALRDLLGRGYEQGLEAVLRAHLNRQWPASRPWWEAVVEVRGRGHTIDAIRIAWTESLRPPVRKRLPSSPTCSRPGRAGQPKREKRRRGPRATVRGPTRKRTSKRRTLNMG